MTILYETIIDSIRQKFSEVSILPSQEALGLEGYRQSALIIHAKTALAITAEVCQGPLDLVTVIRFFSALRPGEQARFRINNYLSDDTFQFAWDKAKTFIITKVDQSEMFTLSLSDKPFLFDDPQRLLRSEILNMVISAATESTFGRDC